MYSSVGGAEQCVNNAACISTKKNAPTHRLYECCCIVKPVEQHIHTHMQTHTPSVPLFFFFFFQTDSDSGCKMKLWLRLHQPVHLGHLAQNNSTARGKSHKKVTPLIHPPPLLLAVATAPYSAMCLHICIWDTAASILCLRNEL